MEIQVWLQFLVKSQKSPRFFCSVRRVVTAVRLDSFSCGVQLRRSAPTKKKQSAPQDACHCEPVSQRWRGNPFPLIEIADPFASPGTTVQGLISRTPAFCSIPRFAFFSCFPRLFPAFLCNLSVSFAPVGRKIYRRFTSFRLPVFRIHGKLLPTNEIYVKESDPLWFSSLSA